MPVGGPAQFKSMLFMGQLCFPSAVGSLRRQKADLRCTQSFNNAADQGS